MIKSHLLCQLSYAPALEVGWKLAQLKLRQKPIIPSRGRMSRRCFRELKVEDNPTGGKDRRRYGSPAATSCAISSRFGGACASAPNA